MRSTKTWNRRRPNSRRGNWGLAAWIAVSVAGTTLPQSAGATVQPDDDVSSASEPASTDPPPSDADADEAMGLRELAEQRFFEEDFAGALRAFEQASELAPHPTDLFNMGRIREEMGELEPALRLYEEFVSQPQVPLEERAAAAERIEVLRKLVEPVDPDQSNEAPRPMPAQGDTSDRGPVPEQHRALVVSGITLSALGAAIAIGGGVGFGIAARRNSDRVADLSDGQNPDRLTLREAEDLEARGRDFETLQIVSLVTGATVTTLGAALLVTGLRRRAKSRRQSVRLETVAPALSTRSLGLQTSWRF